MLNHTVVTQFKQITKDRISQKGRKEQNISPNILCTQPTSITSSARLYKIKAIFNICSSAF